MSEQKWTVLKDEDRIWWLVVQPCDICRYDGILECWDVHSHHSTWEGAMQEANRMAAAHTIVAQAEQIETLSRLLSGAEEAAIERAEKIERLQRAVNYAVINSLQDAFDLVVDGVLHPEDMEAPE